MNTQKTSISYHDFSKPAIADLLMESMDKVQAFAAASGYVSTGDFPVREAVLDALEFSSYCMNKRLLKWHFCLERKQSLRSVNRFLHFVCVKLLTYAAGQQVPRVDLSDQELLILAARAAWCTARDEAETLRLVYVKEKGDFYKR